MRDRIRELRRVRARELLPNPKNWRRHPAAQAKALRALLAEIGYADALLARELPDGRLMLIDGHLRAETTPEVTVPVLVLDVTEAEADKLLLTLDPLAALAEADAARITTLLRTVQTDSDAVQALLCRTAGDDVWRRLHPQMEPPAKLDQAGELQKKWGTRPGQLWASLRRCHEGGGRGAADGRGACGPLCYRSALRGRLHGRRPCAPLGTPRGRTAGDRWVR